MDPSPIIAAIKIISLLNLASVLGAPNQLILTNDCPCPGQNLTYECTATGGGNTVWRGSQGLFDCRSSEIILSHSGFTTAVFGECNSGAITARSLRVDGDRYISQLSISFRESFVGKTVTCEHDDGSAIASESSLTITKNMIVSFPRPSNVHLIDADPEQLTFSWDPVAPHCSAIQYNILTNDKCGECPSTTPHNTVACHDHGVGENITCSFHIQNVRTCDDITGNTSFPVEVNLKVPSAPTVVVIPRYSYSRNAFIGISTMFNQVESFEISNGFDGSPLSYEITYYDSITGQTCGVDVVPASSCKENGDCSQNFYISTAMCSPLPRTISVSVSVNNVLGRGPASRPVTISTAMNALADVEVKESSQRVICTFMNDPIDSEQACTIWYGPQGEDCQSTLQTSQSESNTVTVGLPLDQDENLEYCFSVRASSGVHSVIVEGTFVSDVNATCTASQNTCGAALGASITIFLLLNIATAVAFIITVVYLVYSRKKIAVELQRVRAREGHAIYEDPDYMYVDRPKDFDTKDNISYSIKFANSELSVHYDDTK